MDIMKDHFNAYCGSADLATAGSNLIAAAMPALGTSGIVFKLEL
jgi:hypothetical protein